MLLNRFRLTNNKIDECMTLIDACALEVKDVLVKANDIVHEFLVQYHNKRLILSEKELNSVLFHGIGNKPSHTLTFHLKRSSSVIILPVCAHNNVRKESDSLLNHALHQQNTLSLMMNKPFDHTESVQIKSLSNTTDYL